MRTSDTLSGSLVVPLVGGGSRTGAPRDKSTPTLRDNSVVDSPMVLYYHPMVVACLRLPERIWLVHVLIENSSPQPEGTVVRW